MTRPTRGKGGKFTGSIGSGKAAPKPGSPSVVSPTDDPAYDPYADSTAYQAYLEARYALPLAPDLRAEVDRALAASPWSDAGINTGAAEFTRDQAATIASALNHRLLTWPKETSGSPEAANIRRLFIRFSDMAL